MVSIRRRSAMLRGQSSAVNPPPPPSPLAHWTPELVRRVPPHASSDDINGPCHLNSSPWDVLEPGELEQFGLQMEGEEDHGGSLNMNITKLVEYRKVADDNEKKKSAIPKRKRSNKKNKEIAVKVWKWKEFIPPNSNYCNKIDDKGVLCEKATNPENTLCDYHLQQWQSQSSKEYEDLDLVKFISTNPDSIYYYYDVEYRPSGSKRRTRLVEDEIVKGVKEEEEVKETKEEGSQSVSVAPVTDAMAIEDGTEDGMEEEEEMKRKRGRKDTNASFSRLS